MKRAFVSSWVSVCVNHYRAESAMPTKRQPNGMTGIRQCSALAALPIWAVPRGYSGTRASSPSPRPGPSGNIFLRLGLDLTKAF